MLFGTAIQGMFVSSNLATFARTVGAHVAASHADGLVDSRAHVQRRRRRVMNTCPRMITMEVVL